MLHFANQGFVMVALVVVLGVLCAYFYAKMLAVRSKYTHNPELIEAKTKGEQLQKDNEELVRELAALKESLQELTKNAQEKEITLSSSAADLKAKIDALQSKIEEREAFIAKITTEHESTLTAIKQKAEADLNQAKTEAREELEKTKADDKALLQATKDESQALLEKTKTEAREQLEKTKTESQSLLTKTKEEAAEASKKLSDEHDKVVKKLEEQYKASLEENKAVNEKALSELKAAHEELMKNTVTNSKQTIDKLEKDNTDLKAKLEDMSNTLSEKLSEIASLSSEVNALKEKQEADAKRYEEGNKNLEDRLKTIGEKLLKERSESLQSANKEHMQVIVNPLQKELATFRELINATQKTSSEQAGQLKNELKNLQQAQITLEKQANNLADALTTGAKTQGMWGELQLEKVLEASGLTKNENYVRELFSTNEAGETGRVDVLVQLPQNQGIIIDSKCSLSAYTQYISAENEGDENAAADALKRHIVSVTKHIDELKKKDYPSYAQYGSPNFVFMFVPIDQALTLALRHDPTLYDRAQGDNVYLVSPSTLYPALRLVANLWTLAHQGDKFKQLSKSADAIYRKCDKICKDFDGLKKARDKLNQQVDAINTSLCEGRGNLRRLLDVFSNDAPALTEQAFKNYQHELLTGIDGDENATAIPCTIKPLKQLTPIANATISDADDDTTTEATVAAAADSASGADAPYAPAAPVANDLFAAEEIQQAAAKETSVSELSVGVESDEQATDKDHVHCTD